MAVSGLLGVLSIFLSVIVVGPVSIYYFASRTEKTRSRGEELLQLGGGIAAGLYCLRPRLGFIVAMLAIVPLLMIHFKMEGQFSLLDYLPKESVARSTDQKVEQLFGGADQLVVKLKRDSGDAKSQADHARRPIVEPRPCDGTDAPKRNGSGQYGHK